MAAPVHRIRRLRWQVRAPGAEAGLGMRTLLRELMPDVEAALHQALEAHDQGHALQYLDQLHVQLKLPGQMSAQMLMQELGAALGRALQDAAGEMRAMPLSIVPEADLVLQNGFASSLDEKSALLCALLDMKRRAPQVLSQAVQAAWDGRQGGACSLSLNGRWWQVRESELAHWIPWAKQAISAGPAEAGAAEMQNPYGRPLASPAGLVDEPLSPTVLPRPKPEGPVMPSVSAQDDVAWPPQDAPAAATLQHGQTQLMHYLRTGQIDWMLAGLPADQARRQLQEAASAWVEWGMVPEAGQPGSALIERLGALCRWLSLLTDVQRQVVLQLHGPASHGSLQDPLLKDRRAVLQSALAALLQQVAGSPTDSLHALALWLDWFMAGGSTLRFDALDAWANAASLWMAGLAAQGPSHDGWQMCRAQMPGETREAGGAGVSSSADTDTDTEPYTAGESGSDPEARMGADHGRLPNRSDHPQRLSAETGLLDASRPARPFTKAPAQPLREPVNSRGHVIAQAGLVLLHPYLSRCFQALGLYEQGQRGPMSEALWPRAASLLHWLAVGEALPPLECDLGLIKVLLGREQNEALSHGLPDLLPHEREEANALLQAVLSHWPALKGTSVEGLRQSFLQRRGWLEPLDRAWQIRIEPAAYDMLLGSLPWGLSMVKLPWMDRPMHVEWSAS